MTVCNMSIEAGARAGMIAPDDTTFEYLEGPPARAEGRGLGRGRRARWRQLPTDEGATLRSRGDVRRRHARADDHLRHEPGHGHPHHAADVPDARRRPSAREGARATWASSRASRCSASTIDVVFIGSCTNSRISDLRAAAAHLQGPQGGAGRARAGRAGLAARQEGRPRPRGSTASSATPAPSGARPAARCASP